MGLRESGNCKNGILTVVFALLLVSIGFLTHSAFADQVVATIPVGSKPVSVMANPNTNMVYAADYGSPTISVINGATNSVVGTIAIPDSSACSETAINEKTNMIYAICTGSNISVIDGSTNHVVASIPVSGAPTGIAVNSNTDQVIVAEYESNTGGAYSIIQVIDGATNTVVKSNSVVLSSGNLVLNPNTNTAYLQSYHRGYIMVINVASDTVTAQIPNNGLTGSLAINPQTNRLYEIYGSGAMVVDTTNNTNLETIQTGGYFINADTSTNKIYADWGNTIYVINGSSNVIVQSLQVGNGSNTRAVPIGVNSVTNKIYIANDNDNTVSVIDGNKPIPTAPSAPQNVQATAPTGKSQVYVSWAAPSSNGNSPITNYKIYVSFSSGTEYMETEVGNVTSYNDTMTVYDGRTNYYKVTAVNSVGESPQSNEAYATPTAPPVAPSAPQNLQARTGNAQVSLVWASPTSNGGSAITSYTIYRGTSSDTESVLASVSGSTTSYTDTTVTNGVTYFYHATATNSVGESGPSNPALAVPSAPTSSGSGPSGIALDNVQSTSGTVSSSPYLITLANFNASSGSSGLLLVGVQANKSSAASVTFGGAALTRAVSHFSYSDAEFWYLKNPSGTGNIAVTMSGSTSFIVGAYAIAGVNQTDPIPATAWARNLTGSSPYIAIYTKHANDLVLDLPSMLGGGTLSSPTCTQEWNTSVPGVITGASSSVTVSLPSWAICNWTPSSGGSWDNVGVEVRSSGTSFNGSGTVPGAPSGLKAIGENPGVLLEWKSPSSNGGTPITGYYVYRGTTPGGEDSAPIANALNYTGYYDTGTTNGVTYYYTVRTINSVGTSPPSNEASGTPYTNPSAPQNLVATPGNAHVTLSWSAPASNGGAPITYYEVFRGTSSGTESYITDTGNVTSYLDTAVTNGKTYFYKVRAINDGTASVLSNEASATPGTAPSAPTNLSAASTKTTINLSWNAPSNNGGSAITGYKIYRGLSSGSETFLVQTGNVTGYVDSAIARGVLYFYKVTATNSIGESPFSNEISEDPPLTAPNPPTGLVAAAISSFQINLSWNAPSDNGGSPITGYEVERAQGNLSFGAFSNSTSATFFSAPNATAFSDNGLDSSTTYNYTIFAKSSAGASPPSNTASATTRSSISFGYSNSTSITLNSIQSTSGTTDSSNQITLSNFNATVGTDRLLVVGVSANNNNVGSITFAGVPLTRAVSHFTNNDAEFWYLTNPDGTGDITVTMNGPTQAVVGAYSFSGVNQTVPIPTHLAKHNTTPNSPNISITTKYPNDWVLDLPSIYGGEKLGSPTCMQQWNVNVPNAITGASSSTVVPSPATVTCSWTASSADLWDDVAVEVRSYTSGTSTGTTATAPSAPTGLTATSGNAQVILSWASSATNGGSAITDYKVYRSTISGTETLLTKIGNVTSYTDNTVTNGQAYFYKVTAVNSVGESPQSNEASATPSTSNYEVISTIPLGRGPTGIGVNPDTNMIYVAANAATTSAGPVIVIDGSTNSVTDHITVGSDTKSVGVNPITDRIYVAHWGNKTVDVIDGTTNSVVSKISNKTAFVGVGVNPNTNMIYVSGYYSNNANGTISVIDGTTNKIVNAVSVGHFVAGVGVNPNTNMIYVANEGYFVPAGNYPDDNTVFVIDGTTNSVVGKIHVGAKPYGVGVNPNTNMIYVANAKDNTVSVINGTTNSVIATIPVGSSPGDVGVNPTTNKIYVANSGDCCPASHGAVSIIDGTTNSVVGTIPDGGVPIAVAVNPTTNKIYVANDDQTVSVIDGSSSGTPSTATHPSPPQSLESTAGNSQVSLSWAMPSSNGGSPITSYKVYRGTSSDYEVFLATAGNVTSYIDNTVTNGQTYYYRVTAVNSAGESPMSNEAGAIPTAPSGSGSTSGIVLDNVQSTSGTTDPSNRITLSNFNATAGADRLLIVSVSANNNNVGSITFAGVPLTREVSHFTNNDAEFWYLTNQTGTGDITVTMNGPTQAVVGAYSFSGVNQTVPIPAHITRHNLSPSSPAISITTSHANDWVLDLPSIWGGVTLDSPTCTQQWNVNVPGQITGASSSTVVPSPATVTCSWTASSDNMWDDAAVELRAN